MKQKLFFVWAYLSVCFAFSQSVFINEIHYDNNSADVNEGIEIAGPSGTNVAGWSLVLYNGSNSEVYNTINLSGTLSDEGNGFGVLAELLPSNGLQNGSPDGIALVDNLGTVIQFLSYEGVVTAANGPAIGMVSKDIGVSEGTTPIGNSMQLVGAGSVYSDFLWQAEIVSTFNAVNNGQTFGSSLSNPIINEFVFNHTGAETDEFVEVKAVPNTDLSTFSLIEIVGDSSGSGTINEIISLGRTDTNGYYITPFGNDTFENGTVSLLLVENFTGSLGDDLDTNDDGVLDSLPWSEIIDDIGVNDGGVSDFNYASAVLSQAFDGGANTVGGASRIPNGIDTNTNVDWVRNDFDGQGLPSFLTVVAESGEAINTPGADNRIAKPATGVSTVFINEIDADTQGTDKAEFIELYDGGVGNTPLDGLVIVFYNGNNNLSYNAFDLDGFTTNAEGYFVLGNTGVPNVSLVFGSSGLQNGADAVALYNGDASEFQNSTAISIDNLIDAIVYDTNDADDAELLVLLNAGETQINENELGESAIQSLQRVPNGSGGARNTSTYAQVKPTPGTKNGAIIAIPGELITVLEARNVVEGTPVTITGILTVSDNFSGPAFIQDSTGGIAVFDELVHGEGVFAVGDSITLTGFRAVFNDQIQITSVSNIENNGLPIKPIEPVTITLSELSEHAGELVRVVNTTFPEPRNLLFGNSNFTLTDASGTGALRIDNDVAEVVGLAQPEKCSEITGVIGRFRDFFQLIPRSREDIPCAEEFVPGGSTSNIPREQTLDVVTWNIEWFGDESNSPAAGNPNSDAIQRDSVKTVIRNLKADIIAVQEIIDIPLFTQMVDELDGYSFILSEGTSREPNAPGGQRVGFIYKNSTISPVSSRPMFTSIHPLYNGGDASALVDYPNTPSRFYASGRLPFLMTADVTIEGVTEQIDFIALHARANSSNGPQSRYDMRRYDVEVLKDSLDANFADRKFVIAGDFNDDVDVTVADANTTETSYLEFVNDIENYSIPTAALSEAGLRSYVFNNNMIDHIVLSNELSDYFVEESSTVHFEFFDNDYSSTTSDHFPVSVRLELSKIEPLVVSIEHDNITCNGARNGQIIAVPTGGVAPFSYLWSNGKTTESISNLETGIYYVIFNDASGEDVLSEDIVVSQPEAIGFDVTEDQKILIGYGAKESVILEVTNIVGGVSSYTVLWSTGDITKSIEVSPIETVVYMVTVTDASGCSVVKEITVNVEDVSCTNCFGKGVTICFKGQSLCVSKYAVKYFLRKGAVLGSCSEDVEAPVVVKAKVFPNPVYYNYTNVFLKARSNSELTFKIYTKEGVLVETKKAQVFKGANRIPLKVSSLKRGLYILKIIDAGENINGIRILKL